MPIVSCRFGPLGGDIGAFKDRRIYTRRAFGTTFGTISSREWLHKLKRGFMITKQASIEDDLAEIGKILEDEWRVEEGNFRNLLNGLDKATV